MVAFYLSRKHFLFRLLKAIKPATVANTAVDTVRPSIMVSQATRNSMLKEEVPNLHLLADMAVNVTAATSPQAMEVRKVSMALQAKHMVAMRAKVAMLATVAMLPMVAINHTDTVKAVIGEESDILCRREKKR